MKTPTVSIIVPTFNRADLLPRALNSILAQTVSDWEIVLVDDGSTDNTHEVVARYAARLGERLVFIRQRNGGASRARNTGIDVSRGRFVAFLDSDDEFLPTKLERQLALFTAQPGLGLAYSDCAFVTLDGVRHESAFDEKLPQARSVPFDAIAPGLCVVNGDLFDWLIQGYFIPTIVGMVRRQALDRGARFPVDISYAEEWLFYLQVARLAPAGFVSAPLSLHHHTAGSLARSDKRLNTAGYYRTLQAIETAFPDMTQAQHNAVRRQLAEAARQLGYDAQRTGDFSAARGHFWRALAHRPSGRTVREAVGAALRSLIGPGTPRCSAAPVQDAR